jgi:ppGpp synthetase/RelA/SpoT-type nucleotidyltranferase
VKVAKAEVDRIGSLLRAEPSSVNTRDLTTLEALRTADPAFERDLDDFVYGTCGRHVKPREGKSNLSIVAKLRRMPSLRLAQMEDILGARVVVDELASQNGLVSAVSDRYPEAKVRDLRPKPHLGYRAVHVVLRCGDQPYELQVRTFLQNLWAQTSERLADETAVELKYGGGHIPLSAVLLEYADLLSELDSRIAETQRPAFQLLATESRVPLLWQRLMKARDEARVQ